MANVKRVVAVAGAAILATVFANQAHALLAPEPPKKPTPPKPAPPVPVDAGPVTTQPEIAERIVTTVANVKEGEIVWIVGNSADLPFIQELELAVAKRGATSLLSLSSDALTKRAIKDVSAGYDGAAPKADLANAKVANVLIELPTVIDDSIYLGFPADRNAIQQKARAVIAETIRKRKVRVVQLDNGMYPSASRAKATGLPLPDLTKRFWSGLGADYAAIQMQAVAYAKFLAGAKEVHVTAINGTDLTFQVKGRKIQTSDGVISAFDVKSGGAQLFAYLPAGELYLVPVPGTMKGHLVDDRMIFQGTPVNSITAEIDKGKITKIDAKQGWDFIKPYWDKASGAKAEVGLFDFGINATIVSSATYEPYVAAGMVALATGANEFAGGTNKEPFALTFMLGGATVAVDGVTLIDKGILQPPPAAPAKPAK